MGTPDMTGAVGQAGGHVEDQQCLSSRWHRGRELSRREKLPTFQNFQNSMEAPGAPHKRQALHHSSWLSDPDHGESLKDEMEGVRERWCPGRTTLMVLHS